MKWRELRNKMNKEYNPMVLIRGFVEGYYNVNENYETMKEDMIKEDNNKQSENIEEVFEDTKELLNNARGY